MSRIHIEYSPDFKVPHSSNCDLLWNSFMTGKRQICLSGPRSSGKTSIAFPYILEWCCEWDGFTVLIAREEYASIVDSTLETLNKHILKYPFYDERNPWICDGGMNYPRRFIFPNGSSIRFMGLRDPEKIKGQEPDIFWHNEASRQLSQKPWTLVSGSQAGGRGGAWKRYGRPFSQIIADTNPDAPTHWLYKYFHDIEGIEKHILKRRLWIDFKLTDNAAYSVDGLTLNELGEETYEDLLYDHPPGIDRDRYVFGEWVAAEGAVLNNFDFRKHVISQLPEMHGEHWTHYRGIDFGDNDPFVCLWSSLNRDNGKLVTHREWRRSQTDLEDHVEAVHQYSEEGKYEWSVADSAHRTERRFLNKHGIPTSPSFKDIKETLQLMRRRISHDQWFIFKNLLISRDPRLVRDGSALSIIDEIGKLVYPDKKNGTPADDLPSKKSERHGVDAARYKIAKLDRKIKKSGQTTNDQIDWESSDLTMEGI